MSDTLPDIEEIKARHEAAKAEFFDLKLHGLVEGHPITDEVLVKRKEAHDRYIKIQHELSQARVMRIKK